MDRFCPATRDLGQAEAFPDLPAPRPPRPAGVRPGIAGRAGAGVRGPIAGRHGEDDTTQDGLTIVINTELILLPHDAEAEESIMRLFVLVVASAALAASVGAGLAAPDRGSKGTVKALVSNTASLSGSVVTAPAVIGGVVLPNG
jgi:hypothetical protein